MTLRERIAELENDLAEGRYGSTMHDAGSAREFVCENLKRHLDETANADAEQARLARIGGLVEGFIATEPQLGIERVEYIEGTRYHAGTTLRERGTAHITLLDALEALAEKVK